MLALLKSMPVTRAFGQRIAYLAAWDVPQPAIRMLAIVAILFLWPKKMELGASTRFVPRAAITLQVGDGLRIRVLLVKVADLRGDGSAGEFIADRCHRFASRPVHKMGYLAGAGSFCCAGAEPFAGSACGGFGD